MGALGEVSEVSASVVPTQIRQEHLPLEQRDSFQRRDDHVGNDSGKFAQVIPKIRVENIPPASLVAKFMTERYLHTPFSIGKVQVWQSGLCSKFSA